MVFINAVSRTRTFGFFQVLISGYIQGWSGPSTLWTSLLHFVLWVCKPTVHVLFFIFPAGEGSTKAYTDSVRLSGLTSDHKIKVIAGVQHYNQVQSILALTSTLHKARARTSATQATTVNTE